jgi:hypothetical protein
MRSIGKGRMVEAVIGSAEWKGHVAESVSRVLGAVGGPGGPVRPYEAYGGAVAVVLEVVLAEDVTALRAGDLDKHCRSAGDSLTDAGVIEDDRLIVSWAATKRQCAVGELPHVWICVMPA